MTTPGGHDDVNGSTRVGRTDAPATGTTAGADTTARMTGQPTSTTTVRPTGRTELDYENRGVKHAKTSAAAAFALVFGLSALFCALTGILSPFAVLFGLIGLVLGIVGLKKAKLPGVTGRGVALGGLVTALLGLLLGAAVLAGLAVIVNDDAQLDRIENQVSQLRDRLPSTSEVREELPGQ